MALAVFSVKVMAPVYQTPPSLKLSLAVPCTACVFQHHKKFDVNSKFYSNTIFRINKISFFN